MAGRHQQLNNHETWSAGLTGWRAVSALAVFGSFVAALAPVVIRWWAQTSAPAGVMWWLAVPAAAGVGALWWPAAWKRWSFVVTLVHEMGHAFIGGITGGSPARITIGADTSGLAVWQGRRCRIRRTLSVAAGYPAPGVVGITAVWASVTGGAWLWMLWATATLAITAITMTRNWRAVIVATLSGIAVAAILAFAADVAPVVTTAIGAALLAGALRCTWKLSRFDRQTLAGSDAGQLRKLTFVPTRVVAWLMVAATTGCVVAAVWGWVYLGRW